MTMYPSNPQDASDAVKKMILTLAASGWERLDDGFSLGPVPPKRIDGLKRLASEVFKTATWDGATLVVRGDEAREFFVLYRKAAGRPAADPSRPWS
jgi:hypothetical protein